MNLQKLKHIFEAQTGGKTTIIEDDRGIPSVMVRIPRFNIADVITGGPDVPHPMFIVNGVVKDEMYIGKYHATIYNNRAYSVPDVDPISNVYYQAAINSCYNKGAGWHMMTQAEYAGLALLCKKNGYLPRGNNNNGKNYTKPFERGVPSRRTKNNVTSFFRTPAYLTTTGFGFINNDVVGGAITKTIIYQCGMTTDKYGALIFATTSGIIRYYQGIMKLIVSTTEYTTDGGSICIDRDNNFWISNYSSGKIKQYNMKGELLQTVNTGVVNSVQGICVDKDNNLWVTQQVNSRIEKYVSGIKTATISVGTSPHDICCDLNNNIWVVNYSSGSAKKITNEVVVSTYITAANPINICCDLNNNIYISTASNVTKITQDGVVTTINTGKATLAITVDSSNNIWAMTATTAIKIINDTISTELAIANGAFHTGDPTGMKAAILFGWNTNTYSVGDVINMTYSGNVQEFDTSNIKKMKIECYGGKGGAYGSYAGGLGGYVYGELTLSSRKKFYAYIGGNGDTHQGWNGGGNIATKYGGGATDLRTVKMNDPAFKRFFNKGVIESTLIKDGSTYKMWFTGDDGTTQRILYSESTDGKNWSTPILVMDKGTCTYNSARSQMPSVIKNSNNSYKMWFTGSDNNIARILYSESTDGKVWSTPILVMDVNTCSYNGLSYAPSIIKESDTSYKMWFTGDINAKGRILYSESTDGKVWSTPILVMDVNTCSYNSTFSYFPSIIKESDTSYKMWFTGSDGTKNNILYSESTDGKVWSTPTLNLNYDKDLYNYLITRFIVAGGGGGGCYAPDEMGGFGGGYIGNNGRQTGYNDYCGKGGTQIAGGVVPVLWSYAQLNGEKGIFGYGGMGGISQNGDYSGPGGGGWYGGSGGCGATTGFFGGGGGSSYAAGDLNCPTQHPDGIILKNTGTTAGGNTGTDGKIVITVLETDDEVLHYKHTTGSGPVSWNHDNTPDGIADLSGNVWNYLAGCRLNKGEINLINDNDAAQQNYDTSYSSYNWRSVLADGSLNIPGYVGSLKYDGNTNATFKLSNTLAAQCATALTFPVFDFKTLPILSGLTCPQILKNYGLYPHDTGDYGGCRIQMNNAIECIPMAGASYQEGQALAAAEGIFSLSFVSRTFIAPYIGFRVCYYKP